MQVASTRLLRWLSTARPVLGLCTRRAERHLHWTQKEDPFTFIHTCLLSMFNSLLLHGRGHARECTFYTLRDRPESHAVMWRYLGRLCVFHVPEYLVDTVSDVVREKGGQELTINKVYTFTADDVGNPFTYLAENPIKCPAGLRVARLGRAGVRIMRNTTEHDICRTLDDMVHIED